MARRITQKTSVIDNTNVRKTPPGDEGEYSESGSAPDPESDDNTLDQDKKVGLHIDSDEEHQDELDIGEEINKAEKDLRDH